MRAHPGIRLGRAFFDRPTLVVARALLGKVLIRFEGGQPTGGVIVETEAYIGEEDLACHARAGRTLRTAPLYGPPGTAYIYFNYGMHWLFNVVTEPEGSPAAVLVRALAPTHGLDRIAARRAGRPQNEWTNGPAKLCQALALDGSQNGIDLCAADGPVALLDQPAIPGSSVTLTPRVGLNKVSEPWKSIPWRFLLEQETL